MGFSGVGKTIYIRGNPQTRMNTGFLLGEVITYDYSVITYDYFAGQPMTQQKVVSIDRGDLVTDQGEVLPAGDYVFVAVPKGGPKIREGWFMSFQQAMAALAKDKTIRGEPRAVLDFLMSRLTFENYIVVPQTEIAAEMDMLKQNVNRAIRVLIARNIIEEGPKLGRIRSYKLNSHFAWKGSVVELRKANTARLKAVASGTKQTPDSKQVRRAVLESMGQQRLTD